MPIDPAPTVEPKTSERLVSIDALRGFDMFWIVGGEALVVALADWVRLPGRRRVEAQLEHVEWQGFHFLDLIFPLFLFIVGVVLPFSLGKLREAGAPAPAMYARIFRRASLLFGMGLIYNQILKFDFPNLRITGVLQRIAICYLFAALAVSLLRVRGQVILIAALLLGYWALLSSVAAPGFAKGDFSKEGNLSGYVDRQCLPGKIYESYYGLGDNEGLLSTIPAFATPMIGALAGYWLRSRRPPWTKVFGLTAAGLTCLGVGYAWSFVFPIIKILWTSSFVLFAAGWSLLLLALFYAVIDVLKFRRWAFFFVVIGANALTIYLAKEIIDFSKIGEFFLGGLSGRSGNFAPVLEAAGVVAAEWLFLLHLYRNKIFLRV